jgi:choice-of-anchor B domain-containing protein
MKNLLLGLCSLLCFSATGQPNKNLTLRKHYSFGNIPLSNICGYAKNGKEYALVGTYLGMTIIDVTNPSFPVKITDIPGPPSIWREIKVWQDYAYVTTEGGGGLQIVNLGSLPSSAVLYRSWKGTGDILDQLNTIHALHIDNGYVYIYGSNIENKGAIIASLADPWNPVYVGKFNQSPTLNGYIHDGFVRNDTLWACHIYAGYFSAIDVSDKTNPVQLAIQETPVRATHNSWLSDNSKVLYTTDEAAYSSLVAYDVSDVNDIRELDRITLNNSGSVVHNTHVLNDYTINSWYSDGVVIVDGQRPDNLIVVGHYDTSPLYSGPGYDGCWGVYPYLPSGTIIASDIETGLYIFTPNYVRGCYLEGTVKDSLTNLPLADARIEIIYGSGKITDSSKTSGIYKTGIADSGYYTVKYSKSGYKSKVFQPLKLSNGVLVEKNVKLIAGSGADTVYTVVEKNYAQRPVLNAYPNPFSSNLSLEFKLTTGNGRLLISNILGKTIKAVELTEREGVITLGEELSPGIYFGKIESPGAVSQAVKLIKH